ncbi:MAG: glycosyltransferase family 2 protein [Lachnospiraceae bacterium]|nr:glycosyltransferase family 2 protein [Lachnospiraceae bacterium]
MISVAMTTRNGERYLGAQLGSILIQLEETDELVVSDDGSTDGTPAILQALADKDPRVRLIQGPREGIIANYEHVIRACRGEVIFLSDQDDVWKEDKVKKVMDALEKTGASLVMHDAAVMNEDLTEVLYPSFFAFRGCKSGFFASLVKNRYIGCCMAFRASLRDDFLPIPRTIQMHDQWIGMQCDRYHRGTVLLHEPLLSYRRHEEANSDFSHNSVPVMIRNRFVLMKELLRFNRKSPS